MGTVAAMRMCLADFQLLGVRLTQGPHYSALGKPSPHLSKAMPPTGCFCQATFQKEHGRDTTAGLFVGNTTLL